jgi:hypothetical protein
MSASWDKLRLLLLIMLLLLCAQQMLVPWLQETIASTYAAAGDGPTATCCQLLASMVSPPALAALLHLP